MNFDAMLKKYASTVRKIAYKLNGRFRSFDHDDLYQEAVAHLWEKFQNNALADKTDSYVLQGCYFHLKNYIRTVGENPHTVSIDVIADDENGISLAEHISMRARETGDSRHRLSAVLLAEAIEKGDFNGREKRILQFLKEGMATRYIGRELGISHVMVGKCIKKIREKCRQYTAEYAWAGK